MKLVQIGANSGNDSVYKFVINNINVIKYVVLVEPVPFVIEKLADCYKNVNNWS